MRIKTRVFNALKVAVYNLGYAQGKGREDYIERAQAALDRMMEVVQKDQAGKSLKYILRMRK